MTKFWSDFQHRKTAVKNGKYIFAYYRGNKIDYLISV